MTATLTVATLNLKKGELRWGERAPLMFDQIARLRPDIIGFQEVGLRLDQGNYICRRVNDIIWADNGPPLYRIHHMANPRENVSLEALGIMTHLPVRSRAGYPHRLQRPDASDATLDPSDHYGLIVCIAARSSGAPHPVR